MVAPSVLHLFANIGRDNMARPVIQYGAPILVSAAPRGKLELMTALADHVISLLTWVASTLISALVLQLDRRFVPQDSVKCDAAGHSGVAAPPPRRANFTQRSGEL